MEAKLVGKEGVQVAELIQTYCEKGTLGHVMRVKNPTNTAAAHDLKLLVSHSGRVGRALVKS